jgi:hypothetical protein
VQEGNYRSRSEWTFFLCVFFILFLCRKESIEWTFFCVFILFYFLCRKELIAREASGRVEIYGTSLRKVRENEGEPQAVALPAQVCIVKK